MGSAVLPRRQTGTPRPSRTRFLQSALSSPELRYSAGLAGLSVSTSATALTMYLDRDAIVDEVEGATSWFNAARVALKKMYESGAQESPSIAAVRGAEDLLSFLFRSGSRPSAIDVAPDGGVSISFAGTKRFGGVEFYDSGEVLGLLSDGEGIHKVLEIQSSARSIQSFAQTLDSWVRE